MASENFQKAELEIAGAGRVQCMFNPPSYNITKANRWIWRSVKGAQVPPVEFGGGEPRALSVQLLLDASMEGTGGNIAATIKPLFEIASVARGTSSGSSGAAPPMVTFRWGKEAFRGVCWSVSAEYCQFQPNGDPIRAWVNLVLLEAEQTAPKGQNPTTRSRADLGTYLVKDGDTLPSIAYQAYGDATHWRAIATANGIDNPTQLRRGSTIFIPRLGE